MDTRAEVLRLWAQGHTTLYVARTLHMSRGAVAGILFRARAAGVNVDPDNLHKQCTAGSGRPRKPRVVRAKDETAGPAEGCRESILTLAPVPTPKVSAGLPEVLIPFPAKTVKGGGVPLLRVRNNGCRFPVGVKNNAHVFCNAPATRNSYCEGHYALCYVKPTKQNVKRATATWLK